MKKLIGMTDFVLEQKLELNIKGYERVFIRNIVNYANLLKQPLMLGMFIPCDEKGNVLEEPNRISNMNWGAKKLEDWSLNCYEYQQAKERVLFEGFSVINKSNFYFLEREDTAIFLEVLSKNTKFTIETLLQFPTVTLTESAIKKIGI